MDQELKRPPGALYLMNHYQIGSVGDGWLDGGPINPPGADFQLNVEFIPWGAGATHFIIDDYPQVISNIMNRLLPRVPK